MYLYVKTRLKGFYGCGGFSRQRTHKHINTFIYIYIYVYVYIAQNKHITLLYIIYKCAGDQ